MTSSSIIPGLEERAEVGDALRRLETRDDERDGAALGALAVRRVTLVLAGVCRQRVTDLEDVLPAVT